MIINLNPVCRVIGALMGFIGIMFLVCLAMSIGLGDNQWLSFLSSAIVVFSLGGMLYIRGYGKANQISKREGYLIVLLGWLSVSLVSTLPYWISGSISAYHDCFFESMSGFTTTGATILPDIESLAPSILFWRSLTQWIGGMGIIVLTVALFPLLGIAGIELFVAEAPGPTSDKIHPRIKDTARTLWFLYLGLTGLLFAILWAEGMAWFDALNHALTTMATGGFSTKNDSIAHFTSPAIQYTILLFMLLAGTNYTVIYMAITGKFKKVFMNEEWRMYMIILLLAIVISTPVLYQSQDYGLEESFRHVAFSTVSLVTTTGYVSVDYMSWNNGLSIIFFLLLFTGACAGSTSGGIKLIRHLVFMRNTILEFKRVLHPRAVIRLKVNRQLVAPRIMTHILVFLLVYLFLFVMGVVTLSALGLDFETAIGASATSIGNVGPGIGSVGPVDNWAHLPAAAKWVLTFLMMCGRLELFTVLVLFFPYFWKDN
ncbi:MAG: TrkH family potassium uptake protein [Bacteroidota bacterium]